MTEEIFGDQKVAVYSLALTFFQLLSAVVLAWFANRSVKLSADKWIIIWLFYDAITHFTLEASYLSMSFHGTVAKSEGYMAELWKEYGKADSRWIHFDTGLISLEILTVMFCGPVCIWLIYAIVNNKHYRHFLQITLCVCELYGGWMTFAPEWITGSPSLDTSNALYLWIYLVFFNGLWVVIPLAMLWQSWEALRPLQELSTSKRRKKAN
ncbi:uncharacterized protein TRIADDRAFT_24579 [Trichoplax adhaerens]|uniref:EXPERA domain-containing protein n=1 Tax=Trichoplax adhaerens TaxID=10228 RepID=B3RUE3_TRIAD|nr:hypothetical protein TRIADDRAFT_24579 [Trichoplax adhaerens]EDV25797.1 hypothetical protein TRIADDRAFT_24579 [Trichoplax adhaerens]|eukprot:XP_002111830.1 hypothetical protein TRIADDRAFT_24579 [Trichoplax adhaerens]